MMDDILEKIRCFSDDQYSNENRLKARIQIYEYCEIKLNWREWVFDRLVFNNVKNVLDLGCGNGVLWQDNINKIPADVQITLTDVSEGMVDTARKTLGKHDGRFEFRVADACRVPFKDGSFQMVIANHMLYHVQDMEKVFSEIGRLLTDDGSAYASTLSTNNFQELVDVVVDFNKQLAFDNTMTIQSFSLENGESVLSRQFHVKEKHILQNDIVINKTEPLILYMASCYTPGQLEILMKNYTDFKAYLESSINKTGEIRITNKNVLFKFMKKR
jgi:ubiquinone/menaquinone biosynthesis C-methylase UbiE